MSRAFISLGVRDGREWVVDLDGWHLRPENVMRTTYNGRPAIVIEAFDENGQRYEVYAEDAQYEPPKGNEQRARRP